MDPDIIGLGYQSNVTHKLAPRMQGVRSDVPGISGAILCLLLLFLE